MDPSAEQTMIRGADEPTGALIVPGFDEDPVFVVVDLDEDAAAVPAPAPAPAGRFDVGVFPSVESVM
jgi:hypothetical protein